MNSQTFYIIEPNLSEKDSADVLQFLSSRDYSFRSTYGGAIALLCKMEDIEEGREELEITSNMSISMEDSLSDSIDLFNASDILSQALINLDPKKCLFLIDPYLFPAHPDDDYVDFFFSIFSKTLKEISCLKVFTKGNYNRDIKSQIEARSVSEFGVTVELIETSIFHDRFWIVDGTKGIFIGTSLNGIGKRYSIFDILKHQDVLDIIQRCNNL